MCLSLTTSNATSTTLTVMTIVALIFTPIVLGYQAWTYWVFRKADLRAPSRTQSSRRSRDHGDEVLGFGGAWG